MPETSAINRRAAFAEKVCKTFIQRFESAPRLQPTLVPKPNKPSVFAVSDAALAHLTPTQVRALKGIFGGEQGAKW